MLELIQPCLGHTNDRFNKIIFLSLYAYCITLSIIDIVQFKRLFEFFKLIDQTCVEIYTQNRQNRLSGKVVKISNFRRVFGKINKEMQSNLHTKLQAYILSNIIVIGKTGITEFHQPNPIKNYDDSPMYTAPQFRFVSVKIAL